MIENERNDNQVKNSRNGAKEEIYKEFSHNIRHTIETEINVAPFQISKPLEEKSSVSLHPKFNCYLCGESLITITDLINHHNLNHKGCSKIMVCEECDQICTHTAMLKIHKETEHNIYICARCNI